MQIADMHQFLFQDGTPSLVFDNASALERRIENAAALFSSSSSIFFAYKCAGGGSWTII